MVKEKRVGNDQAAEQAGQNVAAQAEPEKVLTKTEQMQQDIIKYFLPMMVEDALRLNKQAQLAQPTPEERQRLELIVREEQEKLGPQLMNSQGEVPQGVSLPDIPQTPEELRLRELQKEAEALAGLLNNPDPLVTRQMFMNWVRENRVSSAMENKFLLTIPAHLRLVGPKAIFDQISTDIYEKQILAIVTGFDVTNWQDVTIENVEKFLNKPHRRMPDYRTPVGFAGMRQEFLTEIQTLASPDQFDTYVAAMNRLEAKLYGLRFAYYRAFESLRKEAQAIGQDVDATLEDETTVVNPTAEMAAENSLDVAAELSAVKPVDDETKNQILRHAVVEGDPWLQGGNQYKLSVPNLVSAELVPQYELVVDNQTLYFSKLFPLTSDQMAVIAYIPMTTGTKVRSFYRDKNHGYWRYLPDYVRDINGEGMGTMGMGFDEKSTLLPVVMQSALNGMERRQEVVHPQGTNPDFLFAGTAVAYATKQEYHDAFSQGHLRGDFYREVSSKAFNADSNAIIMAGRHKVAPQLLSVNDSVSPNFKELKARFSVYSAFAGQIMGEAYESYDGATTWMMMSDYRGRCWVGNIEMSSPITSTGCRKEWLLPTDIETPLYEASRLADSYGDSNDTRAGSHVSMWNNYLSKVPLLEEYARIVNSKK